jgi:hypothetical protein
MTLERYLPGYHLYLWFLTQRWTGIYELELHSTDSFLIGLTLMTIKELSAIIDFALVTYRETKICYQDD